MNYSLNEVKNLIEEKGGRFLLFDQFKVYKISLIITSLIYIGICFFVYHVLMKNPELSKLLKYSENVQIRELRKEKEDYESIDKKKLFKKFHLI